MKEALTNPDDKLARQEIVASSQQADKELRLLGRIARQPGLTLFEHNPETGQVAEAKMAKEVKLGNGGKLLINGKVIVQPGCRYVQALNEKNARRKFGLSSW